MKVYVIGYMGVGKSTWGKKLASILALPFTDLDAEIEKRAGISITEIFDRQGEAAFRKMERDLLDQFAKSEEHGLLSTGGGAPMNANLMDQMLESGAVVWFQLPPEAIAARVSKSPSKRPLVAGLEGAELTSRISSHLGSRLPVYQRAHFSFSTLNADRTKLEVLAGAIRDYIK